MSQPSALLDLLPVEATSVEVAAWVRRLVRFIGPCFHPDQDFEQYLRGDGQRLFAPVECDRLAKNLKRAWVIFDHAGVDLYGIALPVQRRMLRAGGFR